MTVMQKSKAARDVERKDLLSKMARLFQIAPVKMKAHDGSMVTVEHRVGKVGGVHTLRGLMEKLGLEKQHAEFIEVMIKQIKNGDERKRVIEAHYVGQKNRANRIVSEYRKHLELFYGNYPQPLIPAFHFVPTSDKEEGLYLQGLVCANTFDLRIGEAEDVYRWTEKVFSKTKKWADLNERAQQQAKALMRFQGINKDIKQRLHSISQGEIPMHLGFNG